MEAVQLKLLPPFLHQQNIFFFPAVFSCAGFVCLIDFSVLIEVYLGDSVPIVLWDGKVLEVEDGCFPEKCFLSQDSMAECQV